MEPALAAGRDAGAPARELRQLVAGLHAAGLSVLCQARRPPDGCSLYGMEVLLDDDAMKHIMKQGISGLMHKIARCLPEVVSCKIHCCRAPAILLLPFPTGVLPEALRPAARAVIKQVSTEYFSGSGLLDSAALVVPGTYLNARDA